MVQFNGKRRIYGKRSAARKIQTAWRRRKVKDTIKTKSDVRKAVQSTAPSRAFLGSTSASITTTPSVVQSFSNIPFDDDASVFQSRNSLKISVGSIRGRGNIVVGDSTNYIRILLVRSKNQTNAAFDPAGCFFDNGGSVAVPSHLAQINTRNVECLSDKLYSLQDSTEFVPGVNPSFKFLEFNQPIRNTWTYNAVALGTTIAPRNMKEYYMVVVSDSSVLPNPSIRMQFCTWFKNVD